MLKKTKKLANFYNWELGIGGLKNSPISTQNKRHKNGLKSRIFIVKMCKKWYNISKGKRYFYEKEIRNKSINIKRKFYGIKGGIIMTDYEINQMLKGLKPKEKENIMYVIKTHQLEGMEPTEELIKELIQVELGLITSEDAIKQTIERYKR